MQASDYDVSDFRRAPTIIRLKYGNTNTFFIKGEKGGLLLDTDYAGTLPAFYKAIKNANVGLSDITYVLATHYHPDHMGLVGELMSRGVKLLLVDTQKDHIHFSDGIFKKDNIPYTEIDETAAEVISCKDSRCFLSSLGIDGEIISTPSHSRDGISLFTDDGNCFVGDLEPCEYISAYEENELLKKDWENILSLKPKTVYFSHRPEMKSE
ncbi:MAG: MBL fold metallo-hydrolase [Firmicutes bacterium]|nr:MBL fold metallo-hydrolase [Candidatus Colimorpha enterica]